MSQLINTLKSQTTRVAEITRDRGLDLLGKVRSGTLDWHRTLEARRSELDRANAPKWFNLSGVQLFLIDRVDGALNAFGQRVRGEILRLQSLELGAGATAPDASTAEMGAEPVEAEPAEAKTAAKTEAKPKKLNKRKTSPKKPAARAKGKGPRPAARKRNGKTSRRLVMPIAGYDELTAKEVISELPRLTDKQREIVRAHEASHKKRKTVLAALTA